MPAVTHGGQRLKGYSSIPRKPFGVLASMWPKKIGPLSLTFSLQKNQCCGSGMFIPDPGSDFFSTRIRIFSIPEPRSASKNLSILTQKMFFPVSSRKYNRGCSSWIRIPDPDPDFLTIPDPGSRIQGSKKHRIPDPDPQH
jgi:hypothetical protein